MEQEDQADMTEERGMSPEQVPTTGDDGPPIDPSVNAGREAFGNVSDFGIQLDADETTEDSETGGSA